MPKNGVKKEKKNVKVKSLKKSKTEMGPDKYFVLCSGGVLKDIKELAYCLDQITDEEFSFHVNQDRNDFHNWIKDVFGETTLADEVANILDKKDMQIVVLKHLVHKKR